jgi:hypothetical protein
MDMFLFGAIWGIMFTLATLQLLDKLFEYLLTREKIKLHQNKEVE